MSTRSSSLRRCRPLLGTFVEITAYGVPGGLAEAVERAFDAVARVQQRMSAHDPSSDVGRMNRAPAGATLQVHPHTWRVLARARRLSILTGGAFDVTLGGPARTTFRDLELLADRRVRVRKPIRVDLGGIAKGFAVDQAIRALRAAGVRSACVNAGGDLRVFGERPWPVAVRLPGAPALAATLVKIRNGALATSGGYLRRRRHRGRLVTPLLDRRRRALAPYESVSVLARTCVDADALTKAVLADSAQATRWLRRYRARAIHIDRAGLARRF